ncbi:hypothetical protein [Ornithinimicrobium kibberense]|uniref:hypothetical protein n=1 Tax=Ornithinimicrobium kibberense TaxID=282060 RepID=UPI0036096BD5
MSRGSCPDHDDRACRTAGDAHTGARHASSNLPSVPRSGGAPQIRPVGPPGGVGRPGVRPVSSPA